MKPRALPLCSPGVPGGVQKEPKKDTPAGVPTNAATGRMFSTYVGIIRIRFRVGALTAPSQPASGKLPCFAISA